MDSNLLFVNFQAENIWKNEWTHTIYIHIHIYT